MNETDIFFQIIFFAIADPLALWVECSPMAWETRDQSQVDSYQRLKEEVPMV